MDATLANVGEKLQVGQYPADYNPASKILPKLVPGTAVLNGPTYMGLRAQQGVPTATCMIGPPLPLSAIPGCSLEVTGLTNLLGNTNQIGIFTCEGLSIFNDVNIKNSVSLKNGVDLKNALNLGNALSIDNANAIVQGNLQVNGLIKGAIFTGKALGNKSFDIPHPTLPKTHRLRYVCLEGPESGVYIRGKLQNSNIIELPGYWRDLVHLDTITIHLSPVGIWQELYYEKVEWGTRIVVKNNLGGEVNCDYIIYAERKTVDKLQPEYKGTSPADYPGDNTEYSIAGWDYDRRGR